MTGNVNTRLCNRLVKQATQVLVEEFGGEHIPDWLDRAVRRHPQAWHSVSIDLAPPWPAKRYNVPLRYRWFFVSDVHLLRRARRELR